MDDLKDRQQQAEAHALAVNAGRAPKFGDLMRNPWAGENNPQRDGYFVRAKRVIGKLNPGLWYEMTDKNSNFWEVNGKCQFFIDAPISAPTTAIKNSLTTGATIKESLQVAGGERQSIDTPEFRRLTDEIYGAGQWGDSDEKEVAALIDHIDTWASRSAGDAVPAGFKLVPLQPTNKMTAIGQDLRYKSVNSIGEIYRQMIGAAPAPGNTERLTETQKGETR